MAGLLRHPERPAAPDHPAAAVPQAEVRRGPGLGFSGRTSPSPAFSSAAAETGRRSGSAVTWQDPGVGKRDLVRPCQVLTRTPVLYATLK